MNVKRFPNAAIGSRNDIGLPIDSEANMADQSLIQNGLHRFGIIVASFG